MRALIALLVVNVFGAGAGAQTPELIDVGDHKLALARSGHGSPVVVLESGAGGGLNQWNPVAAGVAEFTSVVAYARAGRDLSEPAKTPRTLRNVVEELRTLLQRAGYQPPYVLVGASLGGIYVRAYATMYPSEIVGLVLVDGSHERQGLEFARANGATQEQYAERFQQGLKDTKDAASRAELEGLAPVLTSGSLGLPGKLPDLPMVVLTNTRADGPPAALKMWRSLHDELFQSTTRGMHILTNKSGHNIAGHEPELVVNAVRWVVDAVREDRAAATAKPASPPPDPAR